jgi:hypothetical protein
MNEINVDGRHAELERLMSLAWELSDAGRLAEAEGAFRAAAELQPDWSVPWYELGLLCKYQLRWAESLAHYQRTVALDPADEAGWWNLGIAATALGEWAEARRAWAGYGISLPDGDGPPEADFGLVPLRLDPAGAGEVVWSRRVDPARAYIENVPLPTSEFRWRDLVLHDGAPAGSRMLNGAEVAVFDVLQRLAPSGYATFVVELGPASAESIEALAVLATELEGAAEDWGTSTNILCRECSLGLPHPHVEEGAEAAPAHPHCGLAARDGTHARQILDRWLEDTPGADLVRWFPAGGE